jgi:sigma-54 dependent transcriptional regulator, acetoin dehydrogenase operon transcriptional activator AcoR
MLTKTDTLDIGGPPPSTPVGAGLVTLYVDDPNAIPSAILLTDRQLLIGRDPPPQELRLPFTSVSRVHARVAFHGAEIVVEDLGSRNGTFVNGVKVRKEYVEHGDEIRVGEVLFKLVTTDAASYLALPLEGRDPPPPLTPLRGGAAMEEVRRQILLTAKVDLSVLILGETGTGKELVARALHDASGRPGGFCAVNCAAIPSGLLESELFGYKRGAFTGADRDRLGIVQTSHGGTLFLDEIGDMPLDAQAKVLRMIETRAVTPLGGRHPEPVDLRIICATHQPLARLVREERFRADLFARISGHSIQLPPLRDRKEDVYQLAHLFLERAGGLKTKVTAAFMIGLLSYDWPFNVRELEAAMKRAVALAPGNTPFDERHLPTAVKDAVDESKRAGPSTPPRGDEQLGTARATGPSLETLRAIFERHKGNVAAVARELGKDRVQIHRWLKRHGLSAQDFRKP